MLFGLPHGGHQHKEFHIIPAFVLNFFKIPISYQLIEGVQMNPKSLQNACKKEVLLLLSISFSILNQCDTTTGVTSTSSRNTPCAKQQSFSKPNYHVKRKICNDISHAFFIKLLHYATIRKIFHKYQRAYYKIRNTISNCGITKPVWNDIVRTKSTSKPQYGAIKPVPTNNIGSLHQPSRALAWPGPAGGGECTVSPSSVGRQATSTVILCYQGHTRILLPPYSSIHAECRGEFC